MLRSEVVFKSSGGAARAVRSQKQSCHLNATNNFHKFHKQKSFYLSESQFLNFCIMKE